MDKYYIHGSSREEQNRLNTLNRITNNSFIRYMGLSEDMEICDFGCGTGYLINDITAKYPGIKITGIEISDEQFREARELNRLNNNVSLFNLNVFENTLPDCHFDICYCRYFLEHVSDPISAVREMVRIVKPGGRIIAQENDLHNVLYYPDILHHDRLMARFCDLQVKMGGDPYIGRKLFSIFSEAGLRAIELDYEPEIYTANRPDSYRAWMENSLNIFRGAREELVNVAGVSENEFNLVCDEFRARIAEPVGVALFHWNRVKAVK